VAQTKAEGELGLAAAMRQGTHERVAVFVPWGCRLADSPLGCFYHIPSSAGCWTHEEKAEEAAPRFVFPGGWTGQLW